MNENTLLEYELNDPEFRKIFQRERLIMQATEAVCEAMEQEDMSRADLARVLETSRGHVTQMLNGSRNLTLRSLSDALTALGYELNLSLERIEHPRATADNWIAQPFAIQVSEYEIEPTVGACEGVALVTDSGLAA